MTIKKLNRHKQHAQVRKWAKRHRDEIHEKFDNKCNQCDSIKDLTIHHKKYEIGMENVEILCNKCHRKFHKKELKKKLLIHTLEDTEKYGKGITMEKYIENLKKRIEDIKVDVIFYKIDGL